MKAGILFFITHLILFSIFAQDNSAIELDYYFTYNKYKGAPLYIEKNIIKNNIKVTIAQHTLKDSTYEIEFEESKSTGVYPKTAYRLYYDFNNNYLETHEIILGLSGNFNELYAISDTINKLDWKITEESKNIQGYPCILATTKYRCRIYHAWFTPEIPLSYGPWKLHGLPGLILEAYDEDKLRTYTLGRYTQNSHSEAISNEVISKKVKKKISATKVSKYYDNIEKTLRANNKIGNSNVDCVDCPNSTTKISLNLWECY